MQHFSTPGPLLGQPEPWPKQKKSNNHGRRAMAAGGSRVILAMDERYMDASLGVGPFDVSDQRGHLAANSNLSSMLFVNILHWKCLCFYNLQTYLQKSSAESGPANNALWNRFLERL